MKYLYYYKNNFGDELSKYIVEHMFNGENVKWSKPFSFYECFCDTIRYALALIGYKRNRLSSLLCFGYKRKVIMAIGSIIGEARNNTLVWGAGVANIHTKIESRALYFAVRGPLTALKLQEYGIATDSIALGDPAVLMPIFYKPLSKKKFKVGIVAHNADYIYIKNILSTSARCNSILLISLKSSDVEGVVDSIAGCEIIVSSSLHGLIVAHSYGIPAIWLHSSNVLGDGSKYLDYLSSVGIQYYNPIRLNEVLLMINNKSFSVIESHYKYLLPGKESIAVLQKSLLKSFQNLMLYYNSNRAKLS